MGLAHRENSRKVNDSLASLFGIYFHLSVVIEQTSNMRGCEAVLGQALLCRKLCSDEINKKLQQEND